MSGIRRGCGALMCARDMVPGQYLAGVEVSLCEKHYEEAVGRSMAAPTPSVMREILPASARSGSAWQQGDSDDAIKVLQMNLQDMGYSIRVCGEYDTMTVAAVVKFQGLHGCGCVDGRADRETVKAINAAYGEFVESKGGEKWHPKELAARLNVERERIRATKKFYP